jgi:hypothetical protein
VGRPGDVVQDLARGLVRPHPSTRPEVDGGAVLGGVARPHLLDRERGAADELREPWREDEDDLDFPFVAVGVDEPLPDCADAAVA